MNERIKQILAGALIITALFALIWLHGNAINFGYNQSSAICAICH